MIVHAEDGELIDETALDGVRYSGFLASRPKSAEEAAITLVVEQARVTRGRAHVVHLSDADAVPLLRSARAGGVDVSVETCPHYLTFEAEQVADGATELKCCPPIREADNREALWAALGSGDLDFVVSDHSPCTASLKESADFGLAWGGIASVQLGLPAVWTGARARGFSLVDVVRWMATASADRVGLLDRGRITVGAQADLVRFAPDASFTVDPSRLKHKNPVSAYAGYQPGGRGTRDLAARRTGGRRCSSRAAVEKRNPMTSYHVPRGGLPPQTALTTDRARFTEAYAVIPARTQSDITASYLPGWDGMRMWVLARPLSGFAETFSQYVVELAPGGGSSTPRWTRPAEAVLFVVSGTPSLALERRRRRRTSWRRAATPTCRPARRGRSTTRPRRRRRSTGSASATSGSTESRSPRRW